MGDEDGLLLCRLGEYKSSGRFARPQRRVLLQQFASSCPACSKDTRRSIANIHVSYDAAMAMELSRKLAIPSFQAK